MVITNSVTAARCTSVLKVASSNCDVLTTWQLTIRLNHFLDHHLLHSRLLNHNQWWWLHVHNWLICIHRLSDKNRLCILLLSKLWHLLCEQRLLHLLILLLWLLALINSLGFDLTWCLLRLALIWKNRLSISCL